MKKLHFHKISIAKINNLDAVKGGGTTNNAKCQQTQDPDLCSISEPTAEDTTGTIESRSGESMLGCN